MLFIEQTSFLILSAIQNKKKKHRNFILIKAHSMGECEIQPVQSFLNVSKIEFFFLVAKNEEKERYKFTNE